MTADWLGLAGKSVIVTGGASGIGLEIARGFLAEGAMVAVCDASARPPDLEYDDGRCLYLRCDVTDRDAVSGMVAEVKEAFGRVDILINNAGINLPRLLVDETGLYELDEAIWDKVMDVNLKGVFFCAQEAARAMLEQGGGVIVNMSSECGLEGSEGQSVYAASKNAVNSLTRSWAKELGQRGIRVVGIAPGILEATGLRTPAYETALAHTRSMTVEQLRAGYSKTGTTPLGRSGRLGEVADAALFLASDRAGYIHGVTINVAGGKTRG